MIRFRHSFRTSVSSTAYEHRDLGDQSFEIVDDTLNDGGFVKITVPASAANQLIQHPSVASAKFVSLTTQAVDPTLAASTLRFRINATDADEIPVKPVGTTDRGFLVMSHDGITALYVSNPSATVAMTVMVAMAGD